MTESETTDLQAIKAIGHDAAAWAEGRFFAALWAQATIEFAMREEFTLPISVQQITVAAAERAADSAGYAEGLLYKLKNKLPSMRPSLTQQYSYWVGYHNELQKLISLSGAWVCAGKVADDAKQEAARAVEAAQAGLKLPGPK